MPNDTQVIQSFKDTLVIKALEDAAQALAHAIYKLKDDGQFSTDIALKGTLAKVESTLKVVRGY